MTTRLRMVAWAQLAQEMLVRDAARRADLEIAAVGSSSPDAAAELAARLGVPAIGDLRLIAREEGVGLLLLADPEPVSQDTRRLIRDLGVTAVSLAPQPISRGRAGGEHGETPVPPLVPLMRRSPGFRAAQQVLESFGQIACIEASIRCGAGEGTLCARLFDAMDLVHALCGPAESVSAALAGSSAEPTETLTELRGHLSANLRCAGDRCAAMVVSDSAAWHRAITVLGPAGCLQVEDAGFTWIDAAGQIIDRHREPAPLSVGDLVGVQIRLMLDRMDQSDPPPDMQAIFAMAEAARLSCRTGQAEAPPRMLEMLARP